MMFLTGRYMEAPTPNTIEITDSSKWWRPTEPTDQMLRIEIEEKPEWLEDVQTVILKGYKLQLNVGKKKIWDLKETGLQSMVIPIFEAAHCENSMIELFAGGFGGWQFANQFMNELSQKRFKTLAVEKVMENCMQYAIQHEAVIFDSFSNMDEHNMRFLDVDHIYQGDVRDTHWQRHVADLRPLVWTVSAPCPPWSSAGKEEGFSNEQGLLMANVCCLLRLHRPKYVLLEQVANFPQHVHYKAFVKLIFFAGYRFVNTNQLEFALQNLAPVKRNRFLAWLVREEDSEPYKGPWITWKHAPVLSMNEHDVFLPSTPEEFAQYQLSFELKLKYMNPEFLPQPARQQGKHPLQLRVPGHYAVQGTFMSMYGHQHEINDEVLARKGLYAQFCAEAGTFRFFKPQEIALLHTIAAPVMFMSIDAGWRTQGDSIVVPHALLALSNVFAQEQLTQYSPDQVIEQFFQRRFRASTSVIEVQGSAIFLASTNEQIQQMKARWSLLGCQGARDDASFVLQTQKVWHPSMGQVDIRSYLGPIEHQIPMPKWQEEVQISPTQPFVVEQREIAFNVMYYDEKSMRCKALVDANCTIDMVLRAWHFLAGPVIQTEVIRHPQWGQQLQIEPMTRQDIALRQDFLLAPRIAESSDLEGMFEEQAKGLIFVVLHDELFLLTVQANHTIEQLTENIRSFCEHFDPLLPLSDVTGELPPHEKLKLGHAYFQAPLPGFDGQEWKVLARAIGNLQVESRVPIHTDHLVVQATGEPTQVAAWRKLIARIFNDTWLKRHGRKMQIQLVHDMHANVIFTPDDIMLPLPISILMEHLTVRLVQAVLIAFECQEADAIPVRFKFAGKSIHHGMFQAEMSMKQFSEALTTACALEFYGKAPRLVSNGKCQNGAEHLSDLLTKKRDPDGRKAETMISMQPPLFGGGPGSKKEHIQAIYAGLVNLAMQYGVAIQDVPHVSQQLFQEYGQARLHHLLFTESEDERAKHFRQLCEESQIALKHVEPVESRIEVKYGRQKRAKQYQAMKNLPIEDYEIQEGYFVLPDGQPATVIKRIAGDVTGVCMITPEQAAPWMIPNQTASCDPLAMFVVGHVDIPSHCRAEKVLVPAIDKQGRGVLLAGQLVQIGVGEITTLPDPSPEVPTQPTGVAAFTFWKDEHKEESWELIRASPVKQAKVMLKKEGLQDCMRSPWARSYRCNKQAVPPTEATSIQFHAEIDDSSVVKFVRSSGIDGLYVTPKTINGAPDPRWKPLWLTPEEAAQRIRFQTARGFAGFIRNEKNLAVRLEVEHFPQAWRQMRPERPQPSLEYFERIFRVGPFAFGTTPAVLHQWLNSIKWTAQPLRMLQSRQWLFAAKDAPPQTILQFNSQPLLVVEVTRKNARAELTLAAGPRPRIANGNEVQGHTSGTKEQENPFRKGDPFFDPWKATAAQIEANKPEVPTQGPIAASLQTQDAKILALEQAVTQLQTKQQEQAAQANNRMQNIETALHETRQESIGAFANLRTEIQATVQAGITQAVAAQEDRMAGSIAQMMAEFRQMCHRGTKRQTSPDDEMRSSQSDG